MNLISDPTVCEIYKEKPHPKKNRQKKQTKSNEGYEVDGRQRKVQRKRKVEIHDSDDSYDSEDDDDDDDDDENDDDDSNGTNDENEEVVQNIEEVTTEQQFSDEIGLSNFFYLFIIYCQVYIHICTAPIPVNLYVSYKTQSHTILYSFERIINIMLVAH